MMFDDPMVFHDEWPPGNFAPAVRIAHCLIRHAIEAGATEIHLVPGAETMRVLFGVEEHLRQHLVLQASIYAPLVTRYKVMAAVSWASRQQPVTGHFSFRCASRYYDIEANFSLRLHDAQVTIKITPRADAPADNEDDA